MPYSPLKTEDDEFYSIGSSQQQQQQLFDSISSDEDFDSHLDDSFSFNQTNNNSSKQMIEMTTKIWIIL